MLVACPNCGGTANIQAGALSKGLATCRYCTAYIVVATSEHPMQQAIAKEKAKLRIKRKENSLSVTGRRPFGGGGRLDKRECVIGGVAGLYVFPHLLGSDSSPLAAFVLAFLVFFIVGVVASFFRFYSPPLVLTEFELKTGLFGATDFLREEVRQIYAVATVLTSGKPGEKGSLHNNICVLTRDGRREVVFGPAKSIEIALAIEQVLEDEMGLYNLRVKGDERTENSGFKPPASQSEDSKWCEVCGAALKPTSSDWDRGFTHCFYCDHLFALYKDGGQAVVLGEGTYAVSIVEDDAGVFLVEAELPFYLDPSAAEVRIGSSRSAQQEVVPFSEVRGVCVRTVGGLDFSGGGMIQRMKEAQARSGEVTVGEIFGAAFTDIGSVSYSILLQMRSGLDRVLVAELSNAQAALQLKDKLQSVIRTLAT